MKMTILKNEKKFKLINDFNENHSVLKRIFFILFQKLKCIFLINIYEGEKIEEKAFINFADI